MAVTAETWFSLSVIRGRQDAGEKREWWVVSGNYLQEEFEELPETIKQRRLLPAQ